MVRPQSGYVRSVLIFARPVVTSVLNMRICNIVKRVLMLAIVVLRNAGKL
jgi:hypothetical protein